MRLTRRRGMRGMRRQGPLEHPSRSRGEHSSRWMPLSSTEGESLHGASPTTCLRRNRGSNPCASGTRRVQTVFMALLALMAHGSSGESSAHCDDGPLQGDNHTLVSIAHGTLSSVCATRMDLHLSVWGLFPGATYRIAAERLGDEGAAQRREIMYSAEPQASVKLEFDRPAGAQQDFRFIVSVHTGGCAQAGEQLLARVSRRVALQLTSTDSRTVTEAVATRTEGPFLNHEHAGEADCIVTFEDGCVQCPQLAGIDFVRGRRATGWTLHFWAEHGALMDDQACSTFKRDFERAIGAQQQSEGRMEGGEEQCYAQAREAHSRCGNKPYGRTEATYTLTGNVSTFPSRESASAAVRLLQQHNMALLQMITQQTTQVERWDTLEANLQDLRRVLARLVCVNDSSLTPSGAYCLHSRDPPVLLGPEKWPLGLHHFPADSGLVELLQPIFYGKSVLDLGAGCGQYGAELKEVDYRGFDGALNVEEFTIGRVAWADLSLPLLADPADFVMMLEVGEHVPRQYEEQVLSNAVDKARCAIVISWAVPGQTGAFHVNLRSNEHVVAKLSARGFHLDAELTRQGRERCQLPWFQTTFMFLWKDEAPQHCRAF